MLQFLDGLSLAQIAWLTPLFFLIHFYDEGPHLVHYFYKYPVSPSLRYNQRKLNAENLVLFLYIMLTVILINVKPDFWLFQAMTLGGGVGMFGNFLFHARRALATTDDFVPGVVTASLLFPVGAFLYLDKMIKLRLYTFPIILVALLLGSLGLPLCIHLSHNVIYKDLPIPRPGGGA